MSLYALVSAGGSPGVTTSALALTLGWPSQVILAECDPSGGDILAGLFAGHLPATKGLAPLALAAGQSADAATAALWQQLIELDDERGRLLLAGVTDPRQGIGLAAAWPVLATALAALPADVIADCGRLDAVAPYVLTVAAVAVLVMRPSLRQVSRARARIKMLSQVMGDPSRVALLLVGEGTLSEREIAGALGVADRRVPAAGPEDRDGAVRRRGRPARAVGPAAHPDRSRGRPGAARHRRRGRRPARARLRGGPGAGSQPGAMTELRWRPPPYLPAQAPAGSAPALAPPAHAAPGRAAPGQASLGLRVPGQAAGGLAATGPQGAIELDDAWLRSAVTDILDVIAGRLDDGAEPDEVMPLIREAVRAWAERQARAGALIPAPADRDALAQAIYDQRYGLGPLAAYLRDQQVENVDVNGCDQVWVTYSTGERVAGPPVAASDEALIAMIRNWAVRGGQTARDFSAAAPLVSVALADGTRMTATMSVTPRPCVSLRRHGQRDVDLARLIQLGTIDATVASLLAAAVRSRCNIIVTGGVNAGKTTLLRALASEIPPIERVATLESEYELYPARPDPASRCDRVRSPGGQLRGCWRHLAA